MTKPIQNLQIAVFTQATCSASAEEIYSAIFRETATSSQKNKFPQPQAPFLSIASGELDRKNLSVQINNGRVDFFIRGIPANSDDLNLELVDPSWAFSHFENNYSAIAGRLGQVYRLAVVTNSGEICSTEADAVSAFGNAIGLKFPEKGITATDLNFQINRRTTLATGVLVNRLTRYNVDLLALMDGSIPPNMPNLMHGIVRPLKQVLVLNTMMDINTVPSSNTPIPEIEQLSILKKLYQFTQET